MPTAPLWFLPSPSFQVRLGPRTTVSSAQASTVWITKPSLRFIQFLLRNHIQKGPLPILDLPPCLSNCSNLLRVFEGGQFQR